MSHSKEQYESMETDDSSGTGPARCKLLNLPQETLLILDAREYITHRAVIQAQRTGIFLLPVEMGALAIFLETQCFILIIQDVKSLATFPRGRKTKLGKL